MVPRSRALGDGDRRAGALAARGLGRPAGWAERRRSRSCGSCQRRCAATTAAKARCGAGARRRTRTPPVLSCGSPAWPASRRSRCRCGRAGGCRPSATGWCRRPRSISTIRPHGSTVAMGRGRVRTRRRHRRWCHPSRSRSSCSPVMGGRLRSPAAARSAPRQLSWSCGTSRHRIVAWAGPWPLEQRWWTPERARRLASDAGRHRRRSSSPGRHRAATLVDPGYVLVTVSAWPVPSGCERLFDWLDVLVAHQGRDADCWLGLRRRRAVRC